MPFMRRHRAKSLEIMSGCSRFSGFRNGPDFASGPGVSRMWPPPRVECPWWLPLDACAWPAAPEMSEGDQDPTPPVVTHWGDEGLLSLPLVLPSHTAHKAVTAFAGILACRQRFLVFLSLRCNCYRDRDWMLCHRPIIAGLAGHYLEAQGDLKEFRFSNCLKQT